MGTFNATCIFSGLPIFESKTQAGLIILVQRKLKGGRDNSILSSTDLWQPMFLPIYGTYDGAGQIKDIQQSPITDHILATIRKMVNKGDIAYSADFKQNHPKEAAFPIKIDSISDFLGYIQQESIEHRFRHYGFGLALFHPDWLPKMKDILFKATDGIDRQKYANTLKLDADSWLNWVIQTKQKLQTLDRASKEHDRLLFSLEDDIMPNEDKKYNAFVEAMRGGSYDSALKVAYLTPFKYTPPDPASPAWTAIRDRLVELCMINIAMDDLNKTWLPFRSAGQRRYRVDMNALYAKELLDAATKMDASLKKELA
jgi:hypothetical protein